MGFAGLWLGLVASTGLTAPDDPKTVIQKAIEAHGGSDVIDKYPAGVIKSKGKITSTDVEVKFNATNRYQLPNLGKNEIEMESTSGEFRSVQLFKGDKVEMFFNNVKQELTDEQASELRQSMYLQELYQLTPLLKGTDWTLKVLDDAPKVGGEETVGISVTKKGRKEVKLFFSKASGLMVQLERKTRNPMDKEATVVQTMSGHKKFDGIVRPTKITTTADGKPFMNVDLDYKHFDQIPASEFEEKK